MIATVAPIIYDDRFVNAMALKLSSFLSFVV